MPRITIVEAGLVLPQLRGRHGSYPEMFGRMIGAADPSIDLNTVSVVNGEPLPDPTTLQAILITGSSAGVHKRHAASYCYSIASVARASSVGEGRTAKPI